MRTVNKNFEIGKGQLAEYINSMQELYNEHIELIKQAEESIFETDYNIKKYIKFCRTWEIIMNKLDTRERNLYICYLFCNCKPEKCIEVFNGQGGNYKNKATMCVMITRIKKKIKEYYDNNN